MRVLAGLNVRRTIASAIYPLCLDFDRRSSIIIGESNDNEKDVVELNKHEADQSRTPGEK
jgi:hypothetical protein